MTNGVSSKDFPWKHSRSGFAIFFLCSLLIAFSCLRLCLFVRFGRGEPVSSGAIFQIFLGGFHQDFLVALVVTLPLLLWFWIIPDDWFSQWWQRILLLGGCFLFWAVQIFMFFGEYYFFQLYHSRLDAAALDRLLHPAEAFTHLKNAYPLVPVIIVCCGSALTWVIIAFRYFRQMWFQPTSVVLRFIHFAVAAVICGLLASTVNLSGSHYVENRVLNELTDNGLLSLFDAAHTRYLKHSPTEVSPAATTTTNQPAK